MKHFSPATSLAGAAALAAIAAIQAAPALATSHAEEAEVHCYGVNSCKGTSDCKTAHNDCKGMNSCKGHGFKVMTAKACEAAGGHTDEHE